MKIYALILALVSTSLVTTAVCAQEIDAVDDVDDRPAKAVPTKSKKGSKSSGTNNNTGVPDFDIRGTYGLLNSESTIGGDGFKVGLPSSSGHFRAYEFRWNTSKALYKFRYRNQSVIFKKLPDGVTPTAVDAVKHHGSFVKAVKPFGESSMNWAKNISFGRGVYYGSRRVERTQPKAVMTSGHSAGFLLGVENVYNVANNLDFEAHADLELPIMFREYYDRTGYYTYGYNVEGGVGLSYTVVPWQQWSIGATFKRSTVEFSGTGEQGVNNGSDVQWDFWFPIEFRVRI